MFCRYLLCRRQLKLRPFGSSKPNARQVITQLLWALGLQTRAFEVTLRLGQWLWDMAGMTEPSYQVLRATQKAVRDGFTDQFGPRMPRAISWVGRAEWEVERGDLAAAFLFYWIAFNAAYAGEIADGEAESPSEKQIFRAYFAALLRADARQVIYDGIWERFVGPICVLLDNPYIFAPFWKAQRSAEDRDGCRPVFERSCNAARGALESRDTQRILEIIFDRLYVLRNQLIHGGATRNSSTNRQQVRDDAQILCYLTSVFLCLINRSSRSGLGGAILSRVGGVK